MSSGSDLGDAFHEHVQNRRLRGLETRARADRNKANRGANRTADLEGQVVFLCQLNRALIELLVETDADLDRLRDLMDAFAEDKQNTADDLCEIYDFSMAQVDKAKKFTQSLGDKKRRRR